MKLGHSLISARKPGYSGSGRIFGFEGRSIIDGKFIFNPQFGYTGHGGWFPGYLSEMEYFPDYKIAIAVQVNTDAQRKLKKGLRAYISDMAAIVTGKQAAATTGGGKP